MFIFQLPFQFFPDQLENHSFFISLIITQVIILTAVTNYYHNNPVCYCLLNAYNGPLPHCIQTVPCLSVLLVHAEWLGFLIIFYPLLPQQRGAPMSYEGSTFIGKLEELSLSGLPLELVVVGGGVQRWQQH